MNVLSWINEINSSRLYGWSWSLGVDGFFSPSIKWIDLKEFLRSPGFKPWRVTSGHRSRFFFFVFLLPLNTFRVYSSEITDHVPPKIPKKVIRIIEIVTLCFCSRNSQEVGTLRKPFPFFFHTDFPKKSKTI